MKNLNKIYFFLGLIISFSIFISCEEENIINDYENVVPKIFDFTGPSIAFQSSTVTYSVTPRGGSEYIWTATGAEGTSVEGRPNAFNVFFNQAEEPAIISVKEKAANGLVSEVTELVVEIVCNPAPGEYLVEMHDSYGDGWQTDDGNGGSGITVDIDGTIVEIGMCNPYVGSDYECVTGDGYDAQAVVTIPENTISASWNFPGDWYGEISFEIYAPDGTLAFASGAPGNMEAGQIPIVVCAD